MIDMLREKDILDKIEEWKKDGNIQVVDDDGNVINIKYAHVVPHDSPCYDQFEIADD